jgi:TRAP-type C4-dicarboxylate transport system substrate-binding protein
MEDIKMTTLNRERRKEMEKSFKSLVIVFVGALFVFGLTISANVNMAQAADTINLTFGGLWPPTHPMSKATQDWIKKIEKETQGRVKIKPFWAGALYKPRESTLELAKGVADIGDCSGSYAPAGFFFEKSMRTIMWGVDDRHLARKAYYYVHNKYPQLEQEFTDAGLRVMAYAGIPPYQVLLAKKRITKAEDFKGVSAKATGDLGKIITRLGGEGINMPMGETYTALQKNTIDAAVAPFETLKTFRFAEVVKYALKVDLASCPAGHWAFSLKSWNKLPPDIQKVFDDNIEWFGLHVEELVFPGTELGIELAKKNGVEFIELPPAELDKVYKVADGVIREKMAELDEKGLPGTAVYEDVRRYIDENK